MITPQWVKKLNQHPDLHNYHFVSYFMINRSALFCKWSFLLPSKSWTKTRANAKFIFTGLFSYEHTEMHQGEVMMNSSCFLQPLVRLCVKASLCLLFFASKQEDNLKAGTAVERLRWVVCTWKHCISVCVSATWIPSIVLKPKLNTVPAIKFLNVILYSGLCYRSLLSFRITGCVWCGQRATVVGGRYSGFINLNAHQVLSSKGGFLH